MHRPHPHSPSPTPTYAMGPDPPWDRIQWRSVVFSDESRFCIDHDDGRVRVWRRSGERYQADCVREHDRRGGASLMMWGERIGPVLSTMFPQ
ncbi:transposable element Tcb1 transposase [Elysia marginata]|uniref:Transposable element Tcb1 transposase n=1 Tax=Elysia marginata TaxID=1093978 RepID=A0AAV4HDY8_9GAST|nr:transposable element Tcb1 transposase [Elysia marginata]